MNADIAIQIRESSDIHRREIGRIGAKDPFIEAKTPHADSVVEIHVGVETDIGVDIEAVFWIGHTDTDVGKRIYRIYVIGPT